MKIILNNQEVIFQLRLSERAHGIYLKISHEDGLEVVTPKRYALHKIPAVLKKKERWILRNLEKISLLGHEKTVRIDEFTRKKRANCYVNNRTFCRFNFGLSS